MPTTSTLLSPKPLRTFRDALRAIRDTDLVIGSAFARTEIQLLRDLASQNRKTRFYVGTQNCFTCADFIKAGADFAKQAGASLSFVVDFRRDESLHWKVALAAPDTVIIGSANFTKKGLALNEDLMAVVQDKNLYMSILKRFGELDSQQGVFDSSSDKFNKAILAYSEAAQKEENARERSGSRKRRRNPYSTKPRQLPSLTAWLKSDEARSIPYFDYEFEIDSLEKSDAKNIKEDAQGRQINFNDLFPYAPGTNLFDDGTIFLDVDRTEEKPRISIAESRHTNKGRRGNWIMFARTVSPSAIGFRISAEEKKVLMNLIISGQGSSGKKQKRLLTVNVLRTALLGSIDLTET